MTTDKLPESKYGIICHENCGKQGLSEENYHDQMMRPDHGWQCPICRGPAEWDDERYEASFPDKDEDDRLDEEQQNTGELPKVFQPTFSSKDLMLVGAAVTFLKIVLKQDPFETKVAKVAVVMMAATRTGGTEATIENLEEINKQFHQLLGHKKCPDCGEYHE